MTAIAEAPATPPTRTEEEERIAQELAIIVDVWTRTERGSLRARFTPEEDRLDLVGRYAEANLKLERIERALYRVNHFAHILNEFLERPAMEARTVDGEEVLAFRDGWEVFLEAVQAVKEIRDADWRDLLPPETRAMWDRVKGGAA